MSLAVLVVDVQQAFREGPHQAFDVERVIATINGLTERARQRGVPVLFVQHGSGAGPFATGGAGWQLAQGLCVQPQDRVVPKRASDAFHETGLATLLGELEARELVVCGIQSDFCIDSTVRRALALGFDVRLVEDAHTTLDNGILRAAQISAHHGRTLASIGTYPGKARLRSAQDALEPGGR